MTNEELIEIANTYRAKVLTHEGGQSRVVWAGNTSTFKFLVSECRFDDARTLLDDILRRNTKRVRSMRNDHPLR